MSFEEQQRQERARFEWRKNLRGVLKSPQGKEVIYELLTRCGVFRISYGPGAEPADVAYLEGRRSIGLQFMDELLEATPEAYMQMMLAIKERNDRDQSNDEQQ
jgi:hypothetical protein